MEIFVNGIKTNYLVFGEGKPFIILHGWGSASDRWIKEAEIISEKGFKVIGVSGNGDFSFDWIAMAKVEIIVPDSEGMEQIKDVFYRKSFDVPQGNYKVLDISVKKQ